MLSSDEVAAIDNLTNWLLSPASRGLPFDQTVVDVCERIVSAGFSLWRTRILVLTHHPEVHGLQFEWTRGAGSTVFPFEHAVLESSDYIGSPVEIAQSTRQIVRVRLEDPAEHGRFRQLRSLIEQGATDYLAVPLHLGDGRVSCMTLATKRPGGYTEADLALCDRVAAIVAFRLELRSVQHALESLLKTYLGQNAAQRVLRGAFRRGGGETIRAAIWYCDLRNFTKLSDSIPARDVVAVLDRFFERIAGCVEREGGEVLKFIGDAVLAIFPVNATKPDGEGDACRRALSAGEQALQSVTLLNRDRTPEQPELAMAVSLHLGDVFYGNIGGKHRLDFTVIGAAVNEAVRIESLSKPLGVPLVMSASFAKACAHARVISLGEHELRGVAAAREVFTLEPR